MKRLVLLLLLFAPAVQAHSPAASHIGISNADAGGLLVRVDVALADLVALLPLDANADDALSWRELSAASPLIHARVADALSIELAGDRCVLDRLSPLALAERSGAPHASLLFGSGCAAAGSSLTVAFDLFEDIDPLHRTYVRTAGAEGSGLAVVSTESPVASLGADGQAAFVPMLREGFAHILEGYDHLLFLLLLILPAAGRGALRERFLGLFAIVTAFTLAHSLTLALASTGTVSLPGKVVEIAIAASIVVAGLLNAWRPAHRLGWRMAFAFGLLHGFGFAGALAEIGLAGAKLFTQLFAFNAGVELGQLMIVAAVLPLLAFLALWRGYRRVVVPVVSAGGAALGLAWTLARL